MEGLAERLSGILETLPSLLSFYGVVFPVFLVSAGAVFFLRNTAPVLFLREQTERLLGWFVALLLLLMVFLSALQIFLRNFFDAGILWIDPLLRHFVLLLAFAGALIATGAKRHVQINVLGRLVKGSARKPLGAGIALASGAICLALAHASLELVRDEIEFAEKVFLNIPSYLVASIFPLAFLGLAFRFSLLCFLELAGEAPPPGEDPPGVEDIAPGTEPGPEPTP